MYSSRRSSRLPRRRRESQVPPHSALVAVSVLLEVLLLVRGNRTPPNLGRLALLGF